MTWRDRKRRAEAEGSRSVPEQILNSSDPHRFTADSLEALVVVCSQPDEP